VNTTSEPIAGNDVFTLFPTLVWNVRLDATSRDAIGAVVDETVGRLAGAAPAPGAGERWASHPGLHRHDALAPLLRFFVEQSRDALAYLHVQHGPLEVVSCAAEICRGGRTHPFRTLANTALAGIYVARAPAGGCRLEFEDPRAQAHIIAPPRTQPTPPDAPLARVEAEPGSLVIFPGWLRHRIVSDDGGQPHVVLVLGLMFGAFAQTIARPKWKGDAG